MKKRILASLLVLGTAALSGCDDSKSESSPASVPTAPTSSSSSSSPASAPEAQTPAEPKMDDQEKAYLTSKKTSLYIKATNAFGSGPLDGTSSWPEKEKKVKAGIEKKDYRVVESFLYFSSRGHVRLKENLQLALKEDKITLDALDEKAEKLIAELDKLIPVWEKLEQYNKTKKFEDDNGAQGKEMMEIFTPAYNSVKALYADFGKDVSAAASEMKKQRMERYKQEGRLLELYSEESIELARGILHQFKSTKDFKNKEKVDAANALLAQLEEKLEAQIAEYKKAEEEGKNPSSYYKTINDQLINFIGDYRKARKSPNLLG